MGALKFSCHPADIETMNATHTHTLERITADCAAPHETTIVATTACPTCAAPQGEKCRPYSLTGSHLTRIGAWLELDR
jgi:hypothetical protein